MRKAIVILSVALPFWASAVEFQVPVTGGNITYRFLPATGTLNDLVAIDGSGFLFHPDNFGGIKKFVLSGESMWVWEGRHSTRLLEENFNGNVYTAKFRYEYRGDSLEFTVKLYPEGKSLVVEFTELGPGGKVRVFGFDRSEPTPEPRIILLPYGHQVLWSNGLFVSGVIDLDVSQASWVWPGHDLFSSSSAYFGDQAEYAPCTDGSYHPLSEKMYITVSPEISDTFHIAANPVSPYRLQLADKIVLDLWGNFEQYRTQISTLANMGLRDLFVIIHVWQKYGYDNGLPSTYPAGDMYGGDAALRQVLQLCQQNNYLFALHTNYVDFYQNSDDWNEAGVALNPDGSWVKAWLNPETGIQSYLLKPTRALSYAQVYEPQIHDGYQTTAGYLDVHTAVLPTMKVDFDHLVGGCGKQLSTLQKYRELLGYVRSVHRGPLAGEGFGYSASTWAGYVDAIEADPRLLHDLWNDRGGSRVPFIVDYKLMRLHGLFVPHGAGYLSRFFLNQWNNYSSQQMELYRLTELAFANAGFLQDPVFLYPSQQEIKRHYCFAKHIQKWAIPARVISVQYYLDGEFFSLSQALRQLMPLTTFNSVNQVLLEQLSRLRIYFDNGLVMYVNRSSTDWQIVQGGSGYRLPPRGFLASVPGQFLAYYAAEGSGEVTYYICPAEDICSTCPGCVSGQPCDDGNPCTHSDTCDSLGRCVGVSYSCSPGECEEFSTCDGLGGCTVSLAPDETPCGPDDNQCSRDVCLNGICRHPPLPAGSFCDDGNPCTVPDFCDSSGFCQAGTDICAGCNDADGDNYGNPASASCPHIEADCDDGDAAIHPGATELCNNRDDNCDGRVDELWPELGGTCATGIGACRVEGKIVCAPDEKSTRCDAVPGSPGEEVCGNDIDEDCDGSLRNGCPCTAGEERPCYAGPAGTENIGVCRAGREICQNGTWTTCLGQVTPGWEYCGDDLDNDCDGLTDKEDMPDCSSVPSKSGCSCGPAADSRSPVEVALGFAAVLAAGGRRRRRN